MKTKNKTFIKILSAITAAATIAIPLVSLTSCESQPELPAPDSITIEGGLATFDTPVSCPRNDTKNPFIIKQEPIQSNPFVNWHIENLDGSKAPDFVYIDDNGLLGITDKTTKAETLNLQVYCSSILNDEIISNKLDLTIIISSNDFNDCVYTLSADKTHYSVTRYKGAGGNVAIAETINGLPVTSIGSTAFSGCSELTGITIPSNIAEIKSNAFYDCSSLTTLDLSKATSLETIGKGQVNDNGAFEGCTSLTSVTIPASVTTIDNGAFEGCTSLTTLDLTGAKLLKTIGTSAFSMCLGLKSLTIPASVTTIDNGAFEGCTSLTSVTIPANVTTIGKAAFDGCTSLTTLDLTGAKLLKTIAQSAFSGCKNLTGTLTIPSSVTSISQWAFYGCSGLTGTLTIPSSVTSVGEGAFYGCSSLTTLDLSKATSLETIGTSAFNSCTSLTSLDLSKATSLKTIGDGRDGDNGAFEGCTSLTSVTIPASVTSIGQSTFKNCTSLISINIDQNNETFSKATNLGSNCQAIIDNTSGTFGPSSKVAGGLAYGQLELPSNITSIGGYAFKNCTGLTTLDLSKATSLETIGNKAFQGCSGLTGTLTIPSSVTSVGEGAFKNCKFGSIDIADGNTKYCKAKNLGANCDAIMDKSTNGLFDNSSIIVGSLICGQLELPSNITSIGGYAFQDCSGLTSVTIPASLKTIGTSAFQGCSGLIGTLIIPESVITIGYEAFSDCSSLTTLDLSKATTLETIGTSAFNSCTSLTSVTIPASVTSVGEGAFKNCKFGSIDIADGNTKYCKAKNLGANCDAIMDKSTNGLFDNSSIIVGSLICGQLELPSNITSIGGYAFQDCSGLTSVTIPASLKTIGTSAFQGCSGLIGTLIIPESVTSISQWAFYGCTGLTGVKLESHRCPSMYDRNSFNGRDGIKTIFLPAGAYLDSYKWIILGKEIAFF